MSNMTRANFIAELQARGWSRFTAAQLQRYLDWALQDIHTRAGYERSALDVGTHYNSVLDIIPFSRFASIDNLVSNSTFEVGITPWTVDAAATLVRSTAQAKFGVASALLTATSPATNSRMQINLLDEPLVMGTKYRLSVWVYGSGTVLGKNVRTTMFETGGAQASENVATSGHPIAAGWKKYTLDGFLHQPDRTNIELHIGATATEAWATNDFIHVDEVECGVVNEELMRTVLAVYAQQTGLKPVPVRAATELEYAEIVWPNTQNPNPVVAAVPEMYFVQDYNLYLYPKPNAEIAVSVHHLRRGDIFTGDTDTSGLPETFDKAIMWRAIYHCAARAKEWEEAASAQMMVDQFVNEQLGFENSQMPQLQERSLPWRA